EPTIVDRERSSLLVGEDDDDQRDDCGCAKDTDEVLSPSWQQSDDGVIQTSPLVPALLLWASALRAEPALDDLERIVWVEDSRVAFARVRHLSKPIAGNG